MPQCTQTYRNAGIDMHFSLSRETIPLATFSGVARSREFTGGRDHA